MFGLTYSSIYHIKFIRARIKVANVTSIVGYVFTSLLETSDLTFIAIAFLHSETYSKSLDLRSAALELDSFRP